MIRAVVVAALVGLACKSSATRQEPPAPTPIRATADAAAPAPSGDSPSRVLDEKLASAALGVSKHVKVYLPRGYDASPTKRYPVFYYLHGLGGSETDWLEGGDLARVADRLGLEAIVVMPDGDDSFYANAVAKTDYDACRQSGAGLLDPSRSKARTCVKARDYETYMIRDLVEWTDRTFRTIAAREGRAIAGLSMGGFGALSLALRNPERYAAAASHSGVVTLLYDGPVPYAKGKVKLVRDVERAWGGKLGVGPWMRSIFGTDLARWHEHDPAMLIARLGPNAPTAAGLPKLYLDCGTGDELLLHYPAMYLHDLLVERGIDHTYWLGPGGHDFRFWGARLPMSLQFLRKHTTPAQ